MIGRIVAFATAKPRWVIAAAALLTALGVFLTVTRFAINTDTTQLIAPDVAWRRSEIAFNQAFPGRVDLIVAVVDALTPEQADAAARRLTEALAGRGDRFASVRQADGGPFFDKHGLLFLTPEELARTTSQLIRQQPLLGPLAADPSLRGVVEAVSLGLRGVRAGEAELAELARPMAALADTFERVLGAKPGEAVPALSWRRLLADEPEAGAAARDLRRLILLQPVQDYTALRPAGAALDLVRASARELGLTPEQGVRVRLTGPAPLADEEFATVADGALFDGVLTIVAVTTLLFLALRSGRIVAAVLVTLFAGLAMTAGLGLLMVGELNLISVAFAVLFVGLGVDFGIQVAVRTRAERRDDAAADLPLALRRAVKGVGPALLLAAVSTAAGFFTFLPTDFRGVSELGLIAGVGMLIAYAASVTLLPALLALLRPPGEHAEVGYAGLKKVDRWIEGHRRLVLAGTAALFGLSLLALPWLRFDSDPLNLRDRSVESVVTFLDLAGNAETSPNTVDVLAGSVEEASTLARRLEALPEVARAVTLDTFVPEGQDEKLALIQDAAFLLDAALTPSSVAAAPDDAALRGALTAAAENLAAVAAVPGETAPAEARAAAGRLAEALRRLAADGPERRVAAQSAATSGLVSLLAQLRAALGAEAVTRETLPPDLKADWVAADGRARVEIFPKADFSQLTAAESAAALARFAAAVRAVAPDATGAPVTVGEAGRTVVWAFTQAGLFALVSITLILTFALRGFVDVVLTLVPLLLAGLFTLALCGALGLPLNFANIIALPLMFGVGVAFHIYYIVAWRAGERDMLASSLTRAILFSALTTGAAFGSLWLSNHPGTASMGRLLTISLFFTLLAAFVIVPAFLGPPRSTEKP